MLISKIDEPIVSIKRGWEIPFIDQHGNRFVCPAIEGKTSMQSVALFVGRRDAEMSKIRAS